MGNTVGSKDFPKFSKDHYILGLWLADGYWRASSIGLTSVNKQLIERFSAFLHQIAPKKPLKIRRYDPKTGEKRRQTAWQVYVNDRPLTRLFMSFKSQLPNISQKHLPAYFAGRIDGDGHVDRKHRTGIRIAYGKLIDAQRDQQLLGKSNVSLYQYTQAKTFVLYFRKSFREKILPAMSKYSVKLAP